MSSVVNVFSNCQLLQIYNFSWIKNLNLNMKIKRIILLKYIYRKILYLNKLSK